MPTISTPHSWFRLLMTTLLTLMTAACSLQKPVEETPPVEIQEPIEEEIVEIPSRPFPANSFYELLVAEFAVRRNRYDLALGNYLQQAHQTRDPGVTARATRMAQFLRADKATMDAAQLWVELEPDNVEAHFTTATVLVKNSRPAEAIDHMIRVLELGGKTNFSAIVASTLKLPETTRDLIEQKIDDMSVKYPNHAQLLISKTLLLQQRGEMEAALQQIREVLVLDDNNLQAVVVEARLLQHLKRDDEAFTRLENVVQRNPNNRRLRLQYARILMAKDIKLAKQQFEILLSTTPNDPDLLLSLGLISKESEQFDDAKNYFQRLLGTGARDTEAHFYLGQIDEHDEQWQEAIEHYKQIQPGADFFNALNRIIKLYIKQDKTDTARQHLLGLRQKYPEQAVRLYLVESELLLATKNNTGALTLLNEALLVHPQHVSLLYARAILHEKYDSLVLMEQDLRAILEQDNNNAIALNTLGYVLANRTQRLEEAYQLITRALAAKPNDPAIMDSLGWAEYRRGNLPEALQLLTDAYTAYPDHEVAAHLGEVLWVLGEKEKAIRIWQQGLKKTPDSEFIMETVQRLTPPQLQKQLPLPNQVTTE